MTTTSDKFRLSLLGLPSITSLDEFSAVTHLSKGLIFRLSKFGDNYYKSFEVDKKSGGKRKISQPCRELKSLQGWINKYILARLSVSQACKGFEKNTNIHDNASPHIGSNAILSLDLEDFFPTIKVNQVWSVFRTIGYSHRMSAVLASICTFENTLPQGSPASPKLSNLVTIRLDKRLLGYVGKHGVVYTRYADDLTFSAYSPSKLFKIYPLVKSIIEDEGFLLNTNKTRIAGPSRQHRVTGLVVTDDEAGVGRQKLRCLRAKIHHLCNFHKDSAPIDQINHLIGWLAFTHSVDPKRRIALDAFIRKMQSKHNDTAIDLLPKLN